MTVDGAWRRRAVTVGGGSPFESQHVVWVQAGGWYADIRLPFVPGAAIGCFAGRSGWDAKGASRYRWERLLDLVPTGGEDIAQLTWEDGLLVERGEWPTPEGPLAYEELWERLHGSESPLLALVTAGACMVRAGDHAITVVGTGADLEAAYRVFEHGTWTTRLVVGSSASSLPDPTTAPDWPVEHFATTEVKV